MLSYQQINSTLGKWNLLHPNRPSTNRNTVIIWVFRILFNIVFLLSVAVLMTTFSRELWLDAFKDVIKPDDYEAMDSLLLTLRGLSVFFMVLSVTIVWMCRCIIRRNDYIVSMETIFAELSDFNNTSV